MISSRSCFGCPSGVASRPRRSATDRWAAAGLAIPRPASTAHTRRTLVAFISLRSRSRYLPSRARLRASTFTRGSPRNPRKRFSVFRSTSCLTASGGSWLALATRATWYRAAAGLMCGSSPLPEAVTRSTGTGTVLPGSAARSASTRAWTALTRSGFVGLRLDPEDEAALYGNGLVAEGRPQKYFGSSKGWPMRAEPTSLPSFEMRLPWAWYGKTAWATPVTRSGYATPVTRVSATRMTRAGRSCARMMSSPPLHEAEGNKNHVHELDPRERDEDAAHAIDPEVAPQDGRRPDGAVAHATECQRDERDDDQGVEDDGGED